MFIRFSFVWDLLNIKTIPMEAYMIYQRWRHVDQRTSNGLPTTSPNQDHCEMAAKTTQNCMAKPLAMHG